MRRYVGETAARNAGATAQDNFSTACAKTSLRFRQTTLEGSGDYGLICRVIVPLEYIESGAYGDLIIKSPKPYSIYLRGTIGLRIKVQEVAFWDSVDVLRTRRPSPIFGRPYGATSLFWVLP